MSGWNPPHSWYDPPEPPEPCCALGEDDPEHDVVQACRDEQAEAAAEARAEAQRDRERDWDYE